MRFRWSFTFEHDIRPPVTVRGEFEREGYEDAFKTAVFLAAKQAPKGFKKPFTSWVCVIESLDQA